MEVVETHHFAKRVSERAKKMPDEVSAAFRNAVSLMKKKKIHPLRGSKPWTFKIFFDGHRFVFCKEGGKYYLITYCKSKW